MYYHIIEYLLHSIGHNSNYGSYIYRYHKKHHTIHYPIQKLLDYKPYKTDYEYNLLSDGFVAYSLPILFLGFINYKVLDYESFINLSVNFILYTYLSDYLHTEIHIKGSWLEKYEWFKEKRRLHFLHHRNVKKNKNVFNLEIDKLLNTYLE
jgi:hypothetical protein